MRRIIREVIVREIVEEDSADEQNPNVVAEHPPDEPTVTAIIALPLSNALASLRTKRGYNTRPV